MSERLASSSPASPVANLNWTRSIWHAIEHVHAVTYFTTESREANRAVGLRGFWMGYFGSRAAPLGAVPAAVVMATFFNFQRSMVARAIPDAWSFASPESILSARAAAAAAALRRLSPSAAEVAPRVVASLERAVEAGDPAGRPLFAANQEVWVGDDPVQRLWQAATSLREHRGDGHVALLVASGLDGCSAHVLAAAAKGVPVEVLRDNRGWSADEWGARASVLADRGIVDKAGGLTSKGVELVEAIEAETDELAEGAYGSLRADERATVLASLERLRDEIVASAGIPYPNPMGLPRTLLGGADSAVGDDRC